MSTEISSKRFQMVANSKEPLLKVFQLQKQQLQIE